MEKQSFRLLGRPKNEKKQSFQLLGRLENEKNEASDYSEGPKMEKTELPTTWKAQK